MKPYTALPALLDRQARAVQVVAPQAIVAVDTLMRRLRAEAALGGVVEPADSPAVVAAPEDPRKKYPLRRQGRVAGIRTRIRLLEQAFDTADQLDPAEAVDADIAIERDVEIDTRPVRALRVELQREHLDQLKQACR